MYVLIIFTFSCQHDKLMGGCFGRLQGGGGLAYGHSLKKGGDLGVGPTRKGGGVLCAGVIGSDVPWLECPACNALTWVITVTE